MRWNAFGKASGRERRFGRGGRLAIPVLFLLVGLASLAAVLYAGVSYQREDVALERGSVQSFREGWSCVEHGTPVEYGCPARGSGAGHRQDLHIVNRLPALASDMVYVWLGR